MFKRMKDELDKIDTQILTATQNNHSSEVAQFRVSTELEKAAVKFFFAQISNQDRSMQLLVSIEGKVYVVSQLNQDIEKPLNWGQVNALVNYTCSKQFEQMQQDLPFDMTGNEKNYNRKIKPI